VKYEGKRGVTCIISKYRFSNKPFPSPVYQSIRRRTTLHPSVLRNAILHPTSPPPSSPFSLLHPRTYRLPYPMPPVSFAAWLIKLSPRYTGNRQEAARTDKYTRVRKSNMGQFPGLQTGKCLPHGSSQLNNNLIWTHTPSLRSHLAPSVYRRTKRQNVRLLSALISTPIAEAGRPNLTAARVHSSTCGWLPVSTSLATRLEKDVTVGQCRALHEGSPNHGWTMTFTDCDWWGPLSCRLLTHFQ
jgi:hypothetical protein